MSRYCFYRTDREHDRDRVGIDLPDLESARREAMSFLGQTIRDDPHSLINGGEFGVVVADESGATVLTYTVSATILAR